MSELLNAVKADCEERIRTVGMETYGHPIDPHDPERDWLVETYHELLDALNYISAEKKRDISSDWPWVIEHWITQAATVLKDELTTREQPDPGGYGV